MLLLEDTIASGLAEFAPVAAAALAKRGIGLPGAPLEDESEIAGNRCLISTPEADAGTSVFAIVPVTVRNGQKRQVASCRMRTRLGLWVANGGDGTEMPAR